MNTNIIIYTNLPEDNTFRLTLSEVLSKWAISLQTDKQKKDAVIFNEALLGSAKFRIESKYFKNPKKVNMFALKALKATQDIYYALRNIDRAEKENG